MAKQLTAPGCKYSIVARVDTTIYSPDQTWTLDVPAGQSDFIAETNEIIIPADAMLCRKKCQIDADLARVNVLGKGSGSLATFVTRAIEQIAGKGKVRVEYGDGKLIAHTDRVDAAQFAAVTAILERFVPKDVEVVQYNHHIEISWRDINKYAACVTVADMEAVNPDYKTDLTSEGEWVYPLTSLQNADQAFVNSPMRKFSVELPSVTNIKGMFRNTLLEGEMTLNLPKVVSWSQVLDNNSETPDMRKLTKVTLIANPAVEAYLHQTFTIWRRVVDTYLEEINVFGFASPKIGADALCMNCSGLKRFRSDLVRQVVQWNSNSMLNAQLDKESVFDIVRASYIGDTGITEKIAYWGIHVDLKDDEEVLAAIDSLKPYGWTINVRWNGTPTSTTSTMAMGTLIYAKVGEMERPDGTTERYLDWGHYVTDWEERGYEQFRSLESAYRYFNLEIPENV